MRHASWTVAVLVLAASSSPAHAQSAEAESLFREGRALLKQGKIAQGCDKLDASNQLEASVGTLLNLGDCREKLGQSASAWAAFRKAEALAKRSSDARRRAEATRRAIRLEPRLSHLVIEVRQPVAGLVIKRDGEVIDAGGWNTALPVDPASYVITAEAEGHRAWRLEANVAPGQRRRVIVVPKLTELPAAERAIAVRAPIERSPASTRITIVEPRARSRTWSTTRGVGVAIGLAGTAALVTGAYFASRASRLQDDSDAICPTAVCDDLEGLRINDQAQQAADRANVALAIGGAAVVTAGVMWLLGTPDDELVVAPAVGDREAGVSVRGRF